MGEDKVGEYRRWAEWAPSEIESQRVAATMVDEKVEAEFGNKIGVTRGDRFLYTDEDGARLPLEIFSFCTHPDSHEPAARCVEPGKKIIGDEASFLLIPLDIFGAELKAGRIIKEK